MSKFHSIRNARGNAAIAIFGVIVIAALAYFLYNPLKTIADLLSENNKLKKAITSLTDENQIGYAKVIKQETKNGKLFTTLKFIETAPTDKTNKILEKQYTIQGDVIFFDALIVKFNNKIVMDGKQKSLYLWRRVYGENTAPNDGFVIENENGEPERYKGLVEENSIIGRILGRPSDKKIFWDAIWALSNDPDNLQKLGIKATYGNAVYNKLKPGLVYVFKITDTGHLYPETVPDF